MSVIIHEQYSSLSSDSSVSSITYSSSLSYSSDSTMSSVSSYIPNTEKYEKGCDHISLQSNCKTCFLFQRSMRDAIDDLNNIHDPDV
jgi:hypothetical protein